jgi:alkanesulfonate monooxygenase SsuD/methylene tetrahydromethanopterin reductase-like flavin-dependent oxidoreductase (luciferase family)
MVHHSPGKINRSLDSPTVSETTIGREDRPVIQIGFCLSTFRTRYEPLRAAAQLIDSLGFASIHTWDHYLAWPDPNESVLESWTTLAALAEATKHVRIGPMVANNLNRHPGRLAKVAATLHEISGGRCDLALGSGSGGPERDMFALPTGNADERIDRLGEALQIIPALWRGEPVTFHGKYYESNEAVAMPAQDPPPRLIVAASLPRTVRFAAKYADGVNFTWYYRERLPSLLAALDEGLQENGRTREGFDCSLHVRWNNLGPEPQRALTEWAEMGFTRVISFVEPPFPLEDIERLARFRAA